jgi:hypothetical protein
MLDKLRNIKEQLIQGKNAVTFDASRFNDPLAEQIRWTALKSGGSNFQTHALVESSPSRMEFQPSLKSKLFGLIFVIAGLSIPATIFAVGQQTGDPDFEKLSLISIPFGLVFVGVGFFNYRKMSKKIVFDKLSGRFWQGRMKDDENGAANTDNALKLGDVHAIQLISQYVRNEKRSYYIYEMNFVLADTKRVNVIRHGGKRQIRRDAEKLSEFLGKPLWDAAG